MIRAADTVNAMVNLSALVETVAFETANVAKRAQIGGACLKIGHFFRPLWPVAGVLAVQHRLS